MVAGRRKEKRFWEIASVLLLPLSSSSFSAAVISFLSSSSFHYFFRSNSSSLSPSLPPSAAVDPYVIGVGDIYGLLLLLPLLLPTSLAVGWEISRLAKKKEEVL